MMRVRKALRLVLPMILGAALVSACTKSNEPNVAVNLEDVKEHLGVVSQARIVLGHQSVGRDVLAGVKSLVKETGVPLRIERINGVPPDDLPGLFHSEIGTNGDPDGKCEAFRHLLVRPEQPQYDLAMMKFCYVDLGGDSAVQVESMLERYSALVADLKEKRPDVRLVHITMPLRADPPGKKTWFKRLLGRDVDGDRANVLRNEFNAGLRARFEQAPIFDLAALESTYADGGRSSFESNDRTYYKLASEYTDDGGHLNPPAQRAAASEFLRVLATALREAPSQQLTDAAQQ